MRLTVCSLSTRCNECFSGIKYPPRSPVSNVAFFSLIFPDLFLKQQLTLYNLTTAEAAWGGGDNHSISVFSNVGLRLLHQEIGGSAMDLCTTPVMP